jgi:hypothetical protein
MEFLKKKCGSILLPAEHIRDIDRELIREEDTFLWLRSEDLKAKY